VTPRYFETLQIPLVAGRDLDERDEQNDHKVVIIDEAIAKRYFAGQDPIGRQIEEHDERVGGQTKYYTIVGVAKNVRHDSPDSRQTVFQAYYTYTQPRYGTLVVRVEGDPRALIPALRKVVASLDPNIPLSKVMTFDERIAKRYATRRLAVLVVSAFSAVTLFLSAVGLYGVLAYSVSQRTREIGIRISLGAQGWNIVRLVIEQWLRIVFLGVGAGIVASLILVRFVASMLYGVSASDPIMLGLAVVVLGLAALLACLLPALRATRINPITALRE
jgi:putative ABC transport system permease protein